VPANRVKQLEARLAAAGFVSAADEAVQLVARAGADGRLLAALVERRLTGEPLAWITGSARFCDIAIGVEPGVYVPRPQTEPLARRAVERLPARGTAIDLCTGSGAIARVLMAARPDARVMASDIDPRAVSCAMANGVDAHLGDLFDPLRALIEATADVIVGAVPYVPSAELRFLQRDTLAFEYRRSYDGGSDGLELLKRIVADAPRFLRRGGALLLELGGDQAGQLGEDLAQAGFGHLAVLFDEDGDARGIEATLLS
jgi:release factor glutamine methyltransferase